MNIRTLYFYASTAFLLLLYGCGGDTPPEKTVGSITFVITEENTPETLSGVSVQLFSDDDPSVTPADRTDNSGRCTFSNIPVGTYRLNLSKPGYESKEGLSQRINGGDNPNKEISLRRVTTELTVSPSVLDFGDNESVIQKSFGLTNPNYMDLSWAVVDADVPWIVSVCDMNGNRKGTLKYNQEIAISVTIDRKQLSGGDNESTIVILSDFGRAELKIKAKSVQGRDSLRWRTRIYDERVRIQYISCFVRCHFWLHENYSSQKCRQGIQCLCYWAQTGNNLLCPRIC